MVTFWCSWCGATQTAEHSAMRVSCRRCAIELWRLLGMRFGTDMVPLRDGEQPPLPAAARKQFRFVNADGDEVGTTQIDPLGVSREPSARRRRGA